MVNRVTTRTMWSGTDELAEYDVNGDLIRRFSLLGRDHGTFVDDSDPMYDVRCYLQRLDQLAPIEPTVGVPASRVARLLGWIRKRFDRG